ncbi:MAG: cobalamin biosynthesis protein, partial [Thiohalocapsa sp.]
MGSLLQVAIGLGCQRGASLATLERAIDPALQPLGAIAVRCIASHSSNADEPALLALVAARGWRLDVYSAE